MSSQRDKFYELFGKGMESGSAGASQAMKSRADLTNLLAGKQAELSNQKTMSDYGHQQDLQSQGAAADRATGLLDQLRQKFGSGRKFSVGVSKEGTNISEQAPNPFAAAAANDRETKGLRDDTNNLEAQIQKMSGDDIKKLKAAQVVKNILKDPHISNMTLARDALAREAIGGRVPFEMVQTVLGQPSIKEKIMSKVGGLVGHPEMDPLTDASRQSYLKTADQLTAGPAQNLTNTFNTIKANGATLAPFLHRTGQLEGVLKNYGSQIDGYTGGQQAAPQPPAGGAGGQGGGGMQMPSADDIQKEMARRAALQGSK